MENLRFVRLNNANNTPVENPNYPVELAEQIVRRNDLWRLQGNDPTRTRIIAQGVNRLVDQNGANTVEGIFNCCYRVAVTQRHPEFSRNNLGELGNTIVDELVEIFSNEDLRADLNAISLESLNNVLREE